ncbi:hypothetical protein EV363DRAFT_1185656 [Boletus edulis]|nr:hypothetical protein EV363DRAFT_1185656 [Boletus edulis]
MRTVLRWLLPLFFLPSHCLFLQRAHHFTLANTDHLHIHQQIPDFGSVTQPLCQSQCDI